MPAALPAATPDLESSTTTHDAGSDPRSSAAFRNSPGSGFHTPTSYALYTRDAGTRGMSPDAVSVVSIFWRGPLDATHQASPAASTASSASGAPGIAGHSAASSAYIRPR